MTLEAIRSIDLSYMSENARPETTYSVNGRWLAEYQIPAGIFGPATAPSAACTTGPRSTCAT